MEIRPFETSTEPDFGKEAVYLANTYPQMLRQRGWLKQRIAGDWTYTKEMAIEELTNITVAYDNEHVQSSNISRSTERVAMLLTDEFLSKKQQEYYRERDALTDQLAYIEWKIEVVERVVKERVKAMDRVIFQSSFMEHRTFREIRAILKKKSRLKKRFYDHDIVSAKSRIISAFAKELSYISRIREDDRYLTWLSKEAANQGGTDGKPEPE